VHGCNGLFPYHAASDPARQTLLITNEDIGQCTGAQGWGWPGNGVLAKSALIAKATAGGGAVTDENRVGSPRWAVRVTKRFV